MIKFWVNSGKRVGESKVNLLSPAIAQSQTQLHSLGGSRGRGLLCPAPQLVKNVFLRKLYTDVNIEHTIIVCCIFFFCFFLFYLLLPYLNEDV